MYYDKIQELVIPEVLKVVKGEVDKWESELHFPVCTLCNVLEENGFDTALEDLETNGFQWDWWLEIEFEDNLYVISGSGFYGGLTFYRKEEV